MTAATNISIDQALRDRSCLAALRSDPELGHMAGRVEELRSVSG